jgi:hypothetical protein
MMMNKKWLAALTAISAVALSSSALCMSRPGFYVGAQLGWGNTDYNVDRTFRNHDLREPGEDGLAGRGYLGFQFNRYFGLETGFAAFSEVDLPGNNGDLSTLQWDVLAKVGTPFSNGFRGDLKFGAAEIITDFNPDGEAKHWGWNDNSHTVIRPVAGASLSYNICSNLSMDLSYLHAFGDLHSKSGEFSPNTDLVTMGLSLAFPT